MSAALAVQKGILDRLTATSTVTDLVPPSAIMDTHHRPVPDTAILIGEAQTIDVSEIARVQSRVFSDLHVWVKEENLTGCNAITGAIHQAIKAGRLPLMEGYHCADAHVSDIRLLRDPDGESSHGIVTVDTLVQEVPS